MFAFRGILTQVARRSHPFGITFTNLYSEPFPSFGQPQETLEFRDSPGDPASRLELAPRLSRPCR